MDWSSILTIVIGASVAVGLPLALRKRKKGGPQKREELYRHLRGVGVKASLAEKGSDKEKIGLGRASGQKSEGLIEVKGRNMDSMNVISVASQYGVNYFLDYLVKNPNIAGTRSVKKTRLVRKKSSLLWGKTVAIEWRGDEPLAQSLNFDHRLKDKLLQGALDAFKGSISIIPESKHGYVRIRTAYCLPSSEAFEAIDITAKHVKSW